MRFIIILLIVQFSISRLFANQILLGKWTNCDASKNGYDFKHQLNFESEKILSEVSSFIKRVGEAPCEGTVIFKSETKHNINPKDNGFILITTDHYLMVNQEEEIRKLKIRNACGNSKWKRGHMVWCSEDTEFLNELGAIGSERPFYFILGGELLRVQYGKGNKYIFYRRED